MPTAVLFDLYNTLVDGGKSTVEALLVAMARDLEVDPPTFTWLWTESRRARFTGSLGDTEAAIRTIATQAGGTPSPAAIRLAAARQLAYHRRLLWPGASTLSTLDALRAAGWRLGVVSNCTHETSQLWKSTPLAPRFEAVAFSCELGVAKPDPAIFLAACAGLPASPTDCLYVGDGADQELAAAAQLGMAVVQTTEFQPASGSWPRQRIGRLADLVPILVSGQPARNPMSGAV
jgi:putative hydrolase of the HAD superfamily